MTIFKCFTNFEKEEAWLAEMAKTGYKLTNVTMGGYHFNFMPGYSGELTYRIDYRTFRKNMDFDNYRAMFYDFGWLHIAGTKCTGAQYFVKIRPDAGEDIFSENLSRAGRYKRISYMWLSLAIAYIPVTVVFFIQNMRNNHGLYLTPGLWEMKGLRFLAAFLFETPFAIMRSQIIFFILLCFYLYNAFKSYRLYKKEVVK